MTTKKDALRIAEKWASALQLTLNACAPSQGRFFACTRPTRSHLGIEVQTEYYRTSQYTSLWSCFTPAMMSLEEFKFCVVRWLGWMEATFDPDQFSALLDLELLTD